MNRWIVGVDGSTGSAEALTWAMAQAGRCHAEVSVVAAWRVPAHSILHPEEVTYDELCRKTELLAGDAASELVASVVSPNDPVPGLELVEGDAASSLIEAARFADLLVVGSRGLGGIRGMLLGSVSHKCVTHCEAPTVVVPAGAPTTVRAVCVGVDGSDHSKRALDWALNFAPPSAQLRLVGVWEPPMLATTYDEPNFPELYQATKESFESLTAGVADADREGEVVRHFAVGKPRDVLLGEAALCDLVVVGARGHGAIGAAVLGSVSSALVNHAEQATVVVPGSGPGRWG
jgi:nucleotide-binding universal stress UspA family protein